MSLKRGVVLSLVTGLLLMAVLAIALHPSLQAAPNYTPPTPLPTNIAENRAAPGDAISASSGGYYNGPVGVLGNFAVAAPTSLPTSIPAAKVDQAGLGAVVNWSKDYGTPVASLNRAGTLDATTLSMGAVTFSGAIKYGTKDTIVNGSTITHGMGTTPSVCMAQAVNAYYTVTVSTIGSTTFVVNTASGANQGGAVNWWCGK
jgi:hypothetical protein